MTGLTELARSAARPWWWRVLQRLPNAFPGKGRLMRLQSPSGPVSFRMSDGSIILVPDGREPLVGFAAYLVAIPLVTL